MTTTTSPKGFNIVETRLLRQEPPADYTGPTVLKRWQDAAAAADAIFDLSNRDKEVCVALGTDARFNLVGAWVVSTGLLDATVGSPREVFKPAIALGNVANIILAHNHPSGSAKPSKADIELTARTVLAGEILDITVLDHVILGSDGDVRSVTDYLAESVLKDALKDILADLPTDALEAQQYREGGDGVNLSEFVTSVEQVAAGLGLRLILELDIHGDDKLTKVDAVSLAALLGLQLGDFAVEPKDSESYSWVSVERTDEPKVRLNIWHKKPE